MPCCYCTVGSNMAKMLRCLQTLDCIVQFLNYLTDLCNWIWRPPRHFLVVLQKSISPSVAIGLINLRVSDQLHHQSPAAGSSQRPLNTGHSLSLGIQAGGDGWRGSFHKGREEKKNLIIYDLSNWKCLSGFREERSIPLSFIPCAQVWLPPWDSWHWRQRATNPCLQLVVLTAETPLSNVYHWS